MAEDKQNDQQQLQGVTYDPKRLRWKSRIHFAGQERYIGRYKNNIEAALAYDQAARIINAVVLACPDAAADATSTRRRSRQLNFPDLFPNDPAVATRLHAIITAAVPAAADAAEEAIAANEAAAEAAAQKHPADAAQLSELAQLASEQLANGFAGPEHSDASAAAAALMRAPSGISAATATERTASPAPPGADADSAAFGDASEAASGAAAADAAAAAAAPAAGSKRAAATKKRGRPKSTRTSQRKRQASAKAVAAAAAAAAAAADPAVSADTVDAGGAWDTGDDAVTDTEAMDMDVFAAAAAAGAAAAAAAAAAEATVSAQGGSCDNNTASTAAEPAAAAGDTAAADDAPLIMHPQLPEISAPLSLQAPQQQDMPQSPAAPELQPPAASATDAAAAAAAATPAAFDTCIDSADWDGLMALIGVGDQLPPDPLLALPSLPLALAQHHSGLGFGFGSGFGSGQQGFAVSQPPAALQEDGQQGPHLQQQRQQTERAAAQQDPQQFEDPAAALLPLADDILGQCMLMEAGSAELQGSTDSSKPSCTPAPYSLAELPLFDVQPLPLPLPQLQQQFQQQLPASSYFPSSAAGFGRGLEAPTLLPVGDQDLLAPLAARAGSNSSTSTGFAAAAAAAGAAALQIPLPEPSLLSSLLLGGNNRNSQQQAPSDASEGLTGLPRSHSGQLGYSREQLLPPPLPQQLRQLQHQQNMQRQLSLPWLAQSDRQMQLPAAIYSNQHHQQQQMQRNLSLQLPTLLPIDRCAGQRPSPAATAAGTSSTLMPPPFGGFAGPVQPDLTAGPAPGGMLSGVEPSPAAAVWSEGPFAALAALGGTCTSAGPAAFGGDLAAVSGSEAASSAATNSAVMHHGQHSFPSGGLTMAAPSGVGEGADTAWAAGLATARAGDASTAEAAPAAAPPEGLLACIKTPQQALAVTGSCLHALTDLELHVLQQPRSIGAVGAMLDWLQAAWHREVVASQAVPLTAGPAAVAAAAAAAKAAQPSAAQPSHLSLLLLDRLMLLVAQVLANSPTDNAMQRGFLLEVLAHLQQGLSEVQDVIVVHGGQAALCRDYLLAWGANKAAACSSTLVGSVIERLVHLL